MLKRGFQTDLEIIVVSFEVRLVQLVRQQLLLPGRLRVHRLHVALQELLTVGAVQAEAAGVWHLDERTFFCSN